MVVTSTLAITIREFCEEQIPIYHEAIPEKKIEKDCWSKIHEKRTRRWVLENKIKSELGQFAGDVDIEEFLQGHKQ